MNLAPEIRVTIRAVHRASGVPIACARILSAAETRASHVRQFNSMLDDIERLAEAGPPPEPDQPETVTP